MFSCSALRQWLAWLILKQFAKMVYGELEHRYEYYDNGILKRAEVIDAEGEVTTLYFDESGMQKK